MRFLFSFSALLSFLTIWAQQSSEDACTAARQQAFRDAYSGKLRYYYFGIAGASKQAISAAKKLGVEAVSGGCLMTDSMSCYNAAVDSIVFAQKGARLSGLR